VMCLFKNKVEKANNELKGFYSSFVILALNLIKCLIGVKGLFVKSWVIQF